MKNFWFVVSINVFGNIVYIESDTDTSQLVEVMLEESLLYQHKASDY